MAGQGPIKTGGNISGAILKKMFPDVHAATIGQIDKLRQAAARVPLKKKPASTKTESTTGQQLVDLKYGLDQTNSLLKENGSLLRQQLTLQERSLTILEAIAKKKPSDGSGHAIGTGAKDRNAALKLIGGAFTSFLMQLGNFDYISEHAQPIDHVAPTKDRIEGKSVKPAIAAAGVGSKKGALKQEDEPILSPQSLDRMLGTTFLERHWPKFTLGEMLGLAKKPMDKTIGPSPYGSIDTHAFDAKPVHEEKTPPNPRQNRESRAVVEAKHESPTTGHDLILKSQSVLFKSANLKFDSDTLTIDFDSFSSSSGQAVSGSSPGASSGSAQHSSFYEKMFGKSGFLNPKAWEGSRTRVGGNSATPSGPAPKAGPAGIYRPIYKLSPEDLSDDVLRHIAGEANMSDPRSVDAVIDSMLNRIGTKGYGPSSNLRDVADAPSQYVGYARSLSAKNAEYLRNRIRAIASGEVPDITHGATEFRTTGSSNFWMKRHPNGVNIGGNTFAANPHVHGQYTAFAKPRVTVAKNRTSPFGGVPKVVPTATTMNMNDSRTQALKRFGMKAVEAQKADSKKLETPNPYGLIAEQPHPAIRRKLETNPYGDIARMKVPAGPPPPSLHGFVAPSTAMRMPPLPTPNRRAKLVTPSDPEFKTDISHDRISSVPLGKRIHIDWDNYPQYKKSPSHETGSAIAVK